MKSNDRYCTYCGVKNDKNRKKCIACAQDLNAKDHLLKEYLLNDLGKKTRLTMDDSLTKVISSYIANHLFGFITLVTLTVCIIICLINVFNYNIIKQNNVKKLNEVANIDTCDASDAKPFTYVCEEGYTLEYKKCIKLVDVAPIVDKVCDEDSEMFDGVCYRKATSNYMDGKGCPDYVQGEATYYKHNAATKKCVQYSCSSINLTNEEITCNSKEEKTGEEIDEIDKNVCPDGFYSIKNNCRKKTDVVDKYSCQIGELKDNICKVKDIKEATPSCEEGYKLDDGCKMCVKEVVETPAENNDENKEEQ